jgi:MFS transporter, DHA2 family, multidrug resistance protein
MQPLHGVRYIIVIVALSFATLMMTIDYSIANVSIPYISGSLAMSNEEGTYVITSFAVANAIALPVTGWLTTRIGAVRLIVLSIILFTLFSVFCGFSWDLEAIVTARFLQGFTAGPLVPLSQSLIVMTSPPEKKAVSMGIWSMVLMVGPVAGPVLGGWITYNYSWPWIFYINVPVGLFAALVLWVILHKQDTPTHRLPLDYVGLIFLMLGSTSLQILLDKGEQWDWWHSLRIRTLGITSAISFIILITWSWLRPKPLIRLQLLKIRPFAVATLFIGLMFASYFGSVILIPLWLQEYMGYTAPWAGIAIAPIGIMPFLFGWAIALMIPRFGPMPFLTLAMLFFSASCFWVSYYFNTEIDIFYVGLSRFFLGWGMLFFITPLFMLATQDIPTAQLPDSTGLFHYVRVIAGGFGTSAFVTLWTRRTIFHHERIGETITAFSPQPEKAFNTLASMHIEGKAALEMINHQVDQQAALLALNDCFYLMGWLFLILILILPIGRRKAIL